MKKLFVLLQILMLVAAAQAQAQAPFVRLYSAQSGERIVRTAAGELVLFGISGNGAQLVKTTASGDTLWTRNLDLSGGELTLFNIRQTADGGFVFTYSRYFDYAKGSLEFHLVKTDALGRLQWDSYSAGALDVIQTADGGFLTTGARMAYGIDRTGAATAATGQDPLVEKYSATGTFQWSKYLPLPSNQVGQALEQNADGSCLLLCSPYYYYASTDSSFVVKINASGTLLWSRYLPATGQLVARAARLTADGGLVVAGSRSVSGSGSDVFVAKVSATSGLSWTKTITGPQNENAVAIRQTADGGYVVAASSSSLTSNDTDLQLLKLSSAGATSWSKTYGGTGYDAAGGVVQTADGGYALLGTTSGFGLLYQQMYLLKTDAAGTVGGGGVPAIISGLNAAGFCNTVTSVPLTVSPAGGTLTGPGITGTTFSPAAAGPGLHTITYAVNMSGTSLMMAQVARVGVKHTVSFSGLSSTYCVSALPVPLRLNVASPAPEGFATFSGPSPYAYYSQVNPQFYPTSYNAGTYTLTGTYHDKGCLSTTSRTVTLQPTSIPTPAVSSARICGSSGSALLNASGSGTGVSYTWYADAIATTPLATGNSYRTPVKTAPSADPISFTYYVQASTGTGCPSQRSSGTLTLVPTAISATAAPAVITQGDMLHLTVAGGSESYGTFTWTGPGVPADYTRNLRSPAFMPGVQPGTYTYAVNYSSNGCASTSSAAVTVQPCTPLRGTYTINKAQPAGSTNFQSFREAFNKLNVCGISGPVTLNVVAGSGPYFDQVELLPVAGASAVNTITLNGNQCELYATSYTNSFNGPRYAIKLNGADYVRLRNLQIRNTSSLGGWGIHLTNGADRNIIQGCTITVDISSTTSGGIVASSSGTALVGAGQNTSNLSLISNVISGGYYGICISGDAAARAPGISLNSNKIIGSTHTGVYLFNLLAPVITATQVQLSGPSATHGMWLNYIDGSFKIDRCKLTSPGLYGLRLDNCNTSGTARPVLVNNLVGGGFRGGSTTYGIYLFNADNLNIWHNSVSVDGSGTGRALLVSSSSTGLDCRNNSFAFSGSTIGYAMHLATLASFVALDYNNYYSQGGRFVFAGSEKADLAALQAAAGLSGHDQHSYQGLPGYKTALDLHVQPAAQQLANRGIYLPGVPKDYDGHTRPTTSPDIGADEYNFAAARLAAMPEETPETAAAATVWPNPFREELTLQLELGQAAPVQLLVTDLTGKRLYHRNVYLPAGPQQVPLELPDLPQGLYLLVVQPNGEAQQQLKIMKH